MDMQRRAPFDRSIDIRMARLRKKMAPNPDHPRVIKTVRGIGYRYVAAAHDPQSTSLCFNQFPVSFGVMPRHD